MPQGGNTQQPTPEADETAVVNEVTGLFYWVVAAGQIEDPVSVQEFLSPVDEAASEPGARTIKEVIEEHLNPEQNETRRFSSYLRLLLLPRRRIQP